MTDKKKGRLRYPAGMLAIAAILRIVVYFQAFTYRFRTDDFGPLIYPAYVAGYDWSSYVSGLKHYYGFGYYWIFAPLFRLISSPKLLLFGIAMVNSALIVLSSLLIYHLLKTYFGMADGWITALFALVPTFFQGDVNPQGKFWLRTDNEIPFYLICWLLVWVLLAAHRAEKKSLRKRCAVAVLASLLLSWGLSVHERALALLLSVAFAELFLYLTKRRWLFQPVAFYVSLAAGFVVERVVRTSVIHALWAGGWPGQNTSVLYNMNLWFLESKTAVKSLLIIFFGNLHSFLIRGFGIPAAAIALIFAWIFRTLSKRKRTAQPEEEQKKWIDPSLLIILVFGVCFTIILCGLSITWGHHLYPGLVNNEYNYGYKGVCYSRYYYLFLGPVVFAVLTYCFRHAKIRRGVIEAVWGIFAVIELIFFAFVFPYCVRADAIGGANTIKRSLGTYIFRTGNETRMGITVFFMVLTLALLTWGITRPETKRRSVKTAVTLTAAFLLLVFGMDRLTKIKTSRPYLKFSDGEAVGEAIVSLKEEDLLPEHVYLQSSNWCYVVQFMNRDVAFLCGTPKEGKLDQDNLICVSRKHEEYLSAGYDEIPVGDFWMYTNCPEIKAAIEGE